MRLPATGRQPEPPGTLQFATVLSWVEEYWIVLGTTRQIEVYRRLESGRYVEVALVSPEDAIDCGSIPGTRLKVVDLFP